jgi:hypothetical protein
MRRIGPQPDTPVGPVTSGAFRGRGYRRLMKLRFLFPAILLSALAPAWLVAAEPEPGAATRYEEADADRDGRISREEFIAGIRNKRGWWVQGSERANTGQNSATPTMFEALDRDRDGFLSSKELAEGEQLRKSRGDNSHGASGSRSNRPAPVSRPAEPPKSQPDEPGSKK